MCVCVLGNISKRIFYLLISKSTRKCSHARILCSHVLTNFPKTYPFQTYLEARPFLCVRTWVCANFLPWTTAAEPLPLNHCPWTTAPEPFVGPAWTRRCRLSPPVKVHLKECGVLAWLSLVGSGLLQQLLLYTPFQQWKCDVGFFNGVLDFRVVQAVARLTVTRMVGI